MSEEKSAIEKLYEEPKAKGFVNHLIGAYLPVHKPTKVWDFKSGQKHKCNVCGAKLMSISDVLGGMIQQDEKLRAEFGPFMQKQINGEDLKVEDHPMYKHVTQGRVLAWQGEKTDTCLCMSCIEDLLGMVQNGLLMGDKNITWRINKLRREEVFDVFKSHESISPGEKEMVEDIEKRVERSQHKKITTFGDLQVLQDLKAKMEKEHGKEGSEDNS